MKMQAVLSFEAADVQAAIEAHIAKHLPNVTATIEVAATETGDFKINVVSAEINQPKARKTATTTTVGGAKRGRKPKKAVDAVDGSVTQSADSITDLVLPEVESEVEHKVEGEVEVEVPAILNPYQEPLQPVTDLGNVESGHFD